MNLKDYDLPLLRFPRTECWLIVHPDLMEQVQEAIKEYPLYGIRIKESALATKAVYESTDRFSEYDETDLAWALPLGLVREVRREPCIYRVEMPCDYLRTPLDPLFKYSIGW